MTHDVAVLDIGSSKITVVIGERGANNTINIKGIGECEYAGFMDGQFLEPEQLAMAVGHAVAKAETNSHSRIRHMYVGVPGEFSATICKNLSISLGRRRKVTDEDINLLHNQGEEDFVSSPDHKLINIQPIYYTLDSEQKIIRPEGIVASKLSGQISYVLAEKRFIAEIDAVLRKLEIETSDYISSPLAQVLFLFEGAMRDNYVLLVDVGHITTSISLARGDGILAQYNFSMGGGHITGDISTNLGVSFTKAESIKRKVELTLTKTDADMYEIQPTRGQVELIPAKYVNEIVMARIEAIGNVIKKCLNRCEYEFPDYIPYHLTGGGLCYLKGGRDVLAYTLEKPVTIAASKIPQLDRPHLSSVLGLMDMVLKQTGEVKKSFLAKLLGK